MSYTTVLAIYPGERFEEMEELRNSHLSAPPIWKAIAKKYTDKQSYPFGDEPSFWALYKDPRLTPSDRSVFMMTFDRTYILRKDFGRAATDIASFMKDHNVGGHWMRIRDILLSDPAVPAIGFHLTSVSENSFEGEWDDATEDHKPFDWEGAWSVYDEALVE